MASSLTSWTPKLKQMGVHETESTSTCVRSANLRRLGRAPDSTRFLVRKAHMRGKAISSQAMAKPANKRPGEVAPDRPQVRGRSQARHAGQARRVSPDLARHGSGGPVLGTLVPSGIHRTCRIVAGLAACSVTWPPPRARVDTVQDRPESWAFSLYLIAILVLAAVSVLIAGETMHRDIGRFDEQRNESVPASIGAPRAAV
jgi:hypothetical protein